MRKAIPIASTIAVLAGLGLLLWAPRETQHGLVLRAYYHHAHDVKAGMPVCVDGVQLGTVARVTVRPELGDRPVELVLALNPPYDLRIPTGSTAQIAEPGILRPKIVDIDTHSANGPPLATGSSIEGRESTDDQAAHALGVVVKAIADQSKLQDHQKPTHPGDRP